MPRGMLGSEWYFGNMMSEIGSTAMAVTMIWESVGTSAAAAGRMEMVEAIGKKEEFLDARKKTYTGTLIE